MSGGKNTSSDFVKTRFNGLVCVIFAQCHLLFVQMMCVKPEKVGVGTEVRRLLERSSSTRLVRPRKAVGSI